MSLDNYLLSYRAQNPNIKERNSGAHPTYLETYQKRIEMLDWTLQRYRSIQPKQEQAHQNNQNQNDLLIINRINEEFYEKEKFAKNNLEKSELRDETDIYRLEETTIQDILSEIGDFIHSNKNYIKY